MAPPTLVSGTASTYETTAVGSTFSNAYDSGATGTDRVLGVLISYEQGTNVSISSVTYNGVALTQKQHTDGIAGPGNEDLDWWFLANPATGSNTLTVNVANTDNRDIIVLAATFQNADQTTITGAVQASTGDTDPGGTDTTIVINTNQDDSLVLTGAVMNAFNSGPMLQSANDTFIVNERVASGSSGMTTGMFSQSAVTAGAYTTGFNINPTAAREWVVGAIELFSPAAAVEITSVLGTVEAAGEVSIVAAAAVNIDSVAGAVVAAGEVATIDILNAVEITSVLGTVTAAGEVADIFPGLQITAVVSPGGSNIVQATETLTISVNDSTGVDGGTYNGVALANVIAPFPLLVGADAPKGGAQMGVNHDLILTNSGTGAASNSFSVEFRAPNGWAFTTSTVNFAGLAANSPYIAAGVTGLEVGDQFVYDATDSQGSAVTVNSDGSVVIDPASGGDHMFDSYILDANDSYAAGNTFTLNVFVGELVESVVGTVTAAGEVAIVPTVINAVTGTVEAAGEVATVFAGNAIDIDSVLGTVEVAGEVATIPVDLNAVSGTVEAAGQINTVFAGNFVEIDSVVGTVTAAGEIATLFTGAGIDITSVAGTVEAAGEIADVITGTDIISVSGEVVAAGEINTVFAGNQIDIITINGEVVGAGEVADVVSELGIISVTGTVSAVGEINEIFAGNPIEITSIDGEAVAAGEIATVFAGSFIDIVAVAGTAIAAGEVATVFSGLIIDSIAGAAIAEGQINTVFAGEQIIIISVVGEVSAEGQINTVESPQAIDITSVSGDVVASGEIAFVGESIPVDINALTGTAIIGGSSVSAFIGGVTLIIVGQNSYITIEDANTYFNTNIRFASWSGLDDLTKERSLITASGIISSYVKEDCQLPLALSSITTNLAHAAAEYALDLVLTPDLNSASSTSSNIRRVRAGSAEVEFFGRTSGSRFPTNVQRLLADCLPATAGGVSGSAVAFGTTTASSFDNPDEYGLEEGYP